MSTGIETGAEQPDVEAEAGAPAAAVEPRRPSLAWLERRGMKLKATIATAGVIVGLVISVIELRDKLFPPPTPIEATVAPTAQVQADVTWRKALFDHPELGGGPFTDEQLATGGALFTVKLSVKGQRGATGHLEWRLLADDVELEIPSWVPRSVPVTTSTDDDVVAQKVWAPLPPDVEEFSVEFTYRDSAGVPRDTERGPVVKLG